MLLWKDKPFHGKRCENVFPILTFSIFSVQIDRFGGRKYNLVNEETDVWLCHKHGSILEQWYSYSYTCRSQEEGLGVSIGSK